MNTSKILKNSIGIFLAFALALSSLTFAEDDSYDAHTTPAQADGETSTPPPAQESTTPPERIAHPDDADNGEMDSSSQRNEPDTPSPTEDETYKDTSEEPPPESMALSITLKWDIPAKESLLRIGDPIAFIAEITTEMENLAMQWQVAMKPAQDLAEDESEWVNLSGKTGPKYTFTVQEGMQSWCWRLFVTTPDGGSVYSEEMRLPKLMTQEEESGLLDDPDAPLSVASIPPLSTATITLTANIPLDEIAFGDEVTLLAEIHNPCEGMLLQWQYAPSDTEATEEEWIDIDGAGSSSYTYIINEENEGWLWRLLITVPEGVEAEIEPEEIDIAGEQAESGEDSVDSDNLADVPPSTGNPDPVPNVEETPVEEAPLPDMPE